MPGPESSRAILQEAGFDFDVLQSDFREARAAIAEPLGQQTVPDLAATPTAVAAALRGNFFPADLGLSSDADQSELSELLARSDVVMSGSQRVWQLKPEARRSVLLQARDNNVLAQSIKELSYSDDGPGDMLRRVLAGQVPDLATISTVELEQLATVSEWLEGTELAKVPPVAVLRRLIAQRELLEPFRTLVGRLPEAGSDGTNDRVVGRADQLERLRAYVGLVPPEQLQFRVTRALSSLWATVTWSDAANEPLIIEGIGGMGKSTLIAKFILDHALFPGVDLPFVYLDFDRAALAPRQPMQLLIDIALQLGIWFPSMEPMLGELRSELRSTVDRLASNPSERSREDSTHTSLIECCGRLRKIVESFNNARAPVVMLFDTFEVVQYDDNAVQGVADLIATLRGTSSDRWSNLRIIVAGRAEAPEIATSQKPITLGPLTQAATQQLIALRNKQDALGLSAQQISALAKLLRSSPLDVTIVMNWLKSRSPDTRMQLIDDIMNEVNSAAPDDNGSSDSIISRRITGILINRMVSHINDPDVQKLAIPGLVVRAVTPDVIRKVMAPASGLVTPPEELPAGAEDELFRRLERERWLVARSGKSLRHLPAVRLAMLDLMRRQDARNFAKTNTLAYEYFSQRAEHDDEARAEAIYHLLLGINSKDEAGAKAALEEAERQWTPAVLPILSSAVDDLDGVAQGYLKVKLGRSVPFEVLRALPTSAFLSGLLSGGKRILQRATTEGLSGLLEEIQRSSDRSELLGLQWEALYRSGRWRKLLSEMQSGRPTGILASLGHALAEGNFDEAHSLDQAAGLPLRFGLRLATRHRRSADWVFKAFLGSRTLQPARAVALNEAYWDLATFVVRAPWIGSTADAKFGEEYLQAIRALCRSEKRLPPAAVTSDALRVLAFSEHGMPRYILRRLDFESHFSTVSSRELQEFGNLVRIDYRPSPDEPKDARQRYGEALRQGQNLLGDLEGYGGNAVIANVSTTKIIAGVVRTLVETGSERTMESVLTMLSLTYPDWLEPLGHALTRAFHGEVPSKLGWWSSITRYLGDNGQRVRSKGPADGHEILSLADEAASLPEAVSAYVNLLAAHPPDAEDFLDLASSFEDWRRSAKVSRLNLA